MIHETHSEKCHSGISISTFKVIQNNRKSFDQIKISFPALGFSDSVELK